MEESGFSSDDIRDITVQEAFEGFLGISIIVLSIVFVASGLNGMQSMLPLQAVFLGLLPVSVVMLGFLTYKVTRMIYEQRDVGNSSLLPKVLMSLVLAVAAVNIGFILVASGPALSGVLGLLRMSLLIVILSMALSISVLSRNLIQEV